MATPTLTKHTLPGVLGPILVDVLAAGRTSPRPAVVIVHGFKGFKDWGMFPVLAARLARAGYTAVSFNMSGSGIDDQGESAWPDRFSHNTFSAELADLGTVITALAAGELGVAPPTAIGLVGHSRGGGMSILQAARDQRVRALVTWAAISHVERYAGQEAEWRARGHLVIENSRTRQQLPLYTDALDDIERNRGGSLDIRGAAARIAVPWLVVHGTADPTVPAAEAEALLQASGRASTQLLLVENAGHTFGATHPLKAEPPELGQVIQQTVGWMGALAT
jgi:pimeloyl-ACP methyl ester carboxylesterase